MSNKRSKRSDADYIDVTKQFKDNHPNTSFKITRLSIKAFESYVAALQQYLNAGKQALK
ncbi:MAG: transcriptional regulator [Bacteroidota bacterium]|nr:transcriptional regulator [Bacteroidota bacterium]